MNLYGSICLSDIPRELIQTAANGKKYLNIEVGERKAPSQYGHTHYIKASCPKAKRQEGVNYYIGQMKPSLYQHSSEQTPPPTAADAQPPASSQDETGDDFPF